MRKVLVLSPHFPPTDAVDMHRVRTTVGHYAANGWTPTVLCARPQDAGRLTDPALEQTLPAGLEIVRAAVPTRPLDRLLGVSALGLRGFNPFKQAGDALLASGGYDLVFISTTAFPLMRLGAIWKARHGAPFVLDFQDPWATYPKSGRAHFRRGPRHSLMRALHRRWEAATVPHADGLMAVSPAYIDLLSAAYPQVTSRPALVSPFGYADADFAAARRLGRVLPGLEAAKTGDVITCLFAGRVAPTMRRQLRALFEMVASGRKGGHDVFARLRFVFVGTGYGAEGQDRMTSALAAETGIADQVIEIAERIPMMDALKSTLAADCLLVMASADTGYTPSKLYSALSTQKALICVGDEANPIWTEVGDLPSVVGLRSDCVQNSSVVGDGLKRALAGGRDRLRAARAAPFEAAACAARDCAFFDCVLAAASS